MRGVSYRVVVERAVLACRPGSPSCRRRSAATSSAGWSTGCRPSWWSPTRTLAMVPLTGRGAEPAALVVHASGLLESLLGLFEAVWRDALPLRLGAGGVSEENGPGADATDLEILSLLLAGLTDASVAKQLDLGLRTVQRRVKRLMELTGRHDPAPAGLARVRARLGGPRPALTAVRTCGARAALTGGTRRLLHAGQMSVWQLLLVGVVMLLGLGGVLVPGVPGQASSGPRSCGGR